MPRAISRDKVNKIERKFTQEDYRVSREQLHHLADMRSAFFAGVDPRRRKELAWGGMVEEDNHRMANLSPDFIHTEYPQHGTGFRYTPYIQDSESD